MHGQGMLVRLLGTAAGGGLPQWNCACANCAAARAGRIPPRTQSGAAISADGGRWILLNAAPDLRAQIESFPALQPRAGGPSRNSPVRGVMLTNADLDHVLGIFLLRERDGRLPVHCTAAVRGTLTDALRMEALLEGYCGIEWEEMTPLQIDGEASGLAYRAIALPGDAPRYAREGAAAGGQSVALEFLDERSGRRLLFAPDVAEITPELRKAMEKADAVIFDGTFWSGDELRALDPNARTAREMGHLPVSGGSLEALRGLKAQRKIYTHINNTNPIFAPGSPERAAVEEAGITIGEDGMEFTL